MSIESLVMLHPETVTERLLLAAASLLPENPLKRYPRTLELPELLQVKCTRVEATTYGLVRLSLGEDGESPSVAIRAELIVAVFESEERPPVGFLSDSD